MSETRTPAVSGTFYPSLPGRLRADVQGFLAGAPQPRSAVAIIAPHAGYVYSGGTAGIAFGAVRVPDTCIILAPNHTGRVRSRNGGSILLTRDYRTPLGDIATDKALGEAIVAASNGLLAEDEIAHSEEHAVEVEIPFVQMRNPAARIVPIVIGWSDWERTQQLANAIHSATKDRNDVLIVASSDMNHYEDAECTADKDSLALDRLVHLDGMGLLEITRKNNITMCGRVPAACACEIAKLRGKTTGELIGYSHSGIINGDNARVVGYAAVLLGTD